MMSEEEVQKRIAEEVAKARQQQFIFDNGKVWLIEALAHTAGMVNRGEFPAEAHRVGELIAQQFLGNAGDGQKAETKDAKPEG
jgi:hypothetical protein